MNIKKRKLAAIIFISCIMIILIIISFPLTKNRVVAKVNGKKIYLVDIENIYMQLDGSYSKTAVLNDLIDELVVVTNAKNLGVEITDEDLTAALEEYEETFPDIYEKGIEIYGDKEFIESIKMQLIYNEVYNKIIEQTMQEDGNKLSEEFYLSRKIENEVPEEMSKDEFLQEYQLEFFDYVFDCWISVQREEAEIEILDKRENKGIGRKLIER